jgi:hypothetical protein
MKKVASSLFVASTIVGFISPAGAHSWRNGWGPFAAGAVTGALVANAYYRPAPVYYGTQYYSYPQNVQYYYPQQNIQNPYPPQSRQYAPPPPTTAIVPSDNGLYYQQIQVLPNGWQRVGY